MEDKTYRLSLKLSDGTTQSADFTIPGDDAVLYTAQTLTDEQKAQARENIGVMSADTTQSKLDEKITNPATAQVGQVIAVKAVDADGKPTDWEAVDMSGGASSWNDLTDKPFGESSSDTLTWDGDTTGLDSFQEMFFRVTGNAAALDDVDLSEAYITMNDGTTLPYFGTQAITEGEHLVLFFGETEDDLFPVYYFVTDWTAYNCRAGVYLASAEGMYFSSLVIPGFEFYKNIKTIDEKFLPDVIILTLDSEYYLYANGNRLSKAELRNIVTNNRKLFVSFTKETITGYFMPVYYADAGEYAVLGLNDAGNILACYTAEYTAE